MGNLLASSPLTILASAPKQPLAQPEEEPSRKREDDATLSSLPGSLSHENAHTSRLRKLQSLDSSQQGPHGNLQSSKRSASEELTQDACERSMKHQRIDPDGGITQSSHGSPVETLLEFAELPKRIRKWTQKITQQSQQQQARLDNLERELRNSTGDDANTCAASTARSEGSGTGVRITQDDEFPASGEEVEDNRSHAVDLSDDRNGEQTIDKAQQAEYENDKYYTEKAASSIIETEDGNQPSNAEIHRTASELLAKAREVTRDFDRKSPLGDYTRLVEQIDLNELAVDDSMDMIKSMAKSNNTEAMEHLQDIKELMGSIRKEKTRCDAKLTVIIAQRWKGRQPDLDLLQQPSGTELIDVPHSKFVKAFGKLERNVEEVVALQVELTKRLRWLKAEDTGKGEQFTKLLGLSRKLEAELSAKSMLERQCDNRCVEVLQLDAGIRELVTILINDEEVLTTMAR
ncbi:hypothetical protein GN244_ATG03314 [Phytophthora infestans]|uniref:Uncharacterized protein n=1 Tax=Phytophthora infestans TaxID=4787 RepID=A0A833WL54_PHYIN|nr:hypothetical protein GN244_ATG03314 [Phytophthora infestans]